MYLFSEKKILNCIFEHPLFFLFLDFTINFPYTYNMERKSSIQCESFFTRLLANRKRPNSDGPDDSDFHQQIIAILP